MMTPILAPDGRLALRNDGDDDDDDDDDPLFVCCILVAALIYIYPAQYPRQTLLLDRVDLTPF